MSCLVTAITDPPHNHGQNQDSVVVQKKKTTTGKEAILAIVSDGMGEQGQAASASVAKAFSEWFLDFCNSDKEISSEFIQKSWDTIIKKATKRLYQKFGGDSGATMAVFLVVDQDWYMSNVGDVRVYEITEVGVKQLSTDHTYAAREVALGHMEPSEAVNDPKAFYVFQSLGKTKDIVSSTAYGQVEPFASYIICSSGFHHQHKMSALYRELSPRHLDESNAESVLTSMIAERITDEDASIVLLLSSSEKSEEQASAEEVVVADEPKNIVSSEDEIEDLFSHELTEEDSEMEESDTELEQLFNKPQTEKGGQK